MVCLAFHNLVKNVAVELEEVERESKISSEVLPLADKFHNAELDAMSTNYGEAMLVNKSR